MSGFNFLEYQRQARAFALYPASAAIQYPVLGLLEECGEVAGQVKRMIRDDGGVLTDARREKLAAELGDVLWYVAALAGDVHPESGEALSDAFTTLERFGVARLYAAASVAGIMGVAEILGDRAAAVALKARSGDVAATRVALGAFAGTWYGLCAALQLSVASVAAANLAKLADRRKRGVVKGEGSSR